jgi:hypothetical protein
VAEQGQGHRAVPLYQACTQFLQAALAASLVAGEWPDASELAADRAAARDAATPVPERVWALRNVAATAAMSGAGGVARAVQLLDKALALKQEWVGSAEHPSKLNGQPPAAFLGVQLFLFTRCIVCEPNCLQIQLAACHM